MKSRIWSSIALIAVLLVGFGAAPLARAQEGPIKIAVAGSYTGDYSIYGQTEFRGAELAAEEINAAGGVLGRQIELVQMDDKAQPQEAASVAQKAAADPSISAVIGHIFSSTSLAAGPIYQRAQLPAIAVLASNPKVPDVGDYIFRINIDDKVVGAEMAKYTVEKMGKKRIAVILDQTDYTQGVYDSFAAKAKELGAEIVSEQKFVGQQDKDFSVQLTSIRDANPDVIFIDAYHTEGALITQQARNLGIEADLILPDSSATPDYINLAGDSAEGVIAFAYFDRSIDDPKIQELVKKYEEKYGEPIFTTVPFAYDAMYVLAEAIKEAGSADRTAIRDALDQKINDYPGVTGPISFDERGDRPVGWNVVLKVEDGQFKVLELTQENE
ncbi:MAG: ABC transporter substrate-binding protein [Thermomicrobiales bacterium]|nr:ABC transporter substrate-binding protein [Thermomicrobiales bacterium]